MNTESLPAPAVVPTSPALLGWAGLSDCGLVRKENEDSFVVAGLTDAGRSSRQPDAGALAQIPAGGCLFVVSDGVGGANAGEVASRMATEVLPEALAGADVRPAEMTNRACGRRLESAIRHANGRIRQEAVADPHRAGMAATLSALWLLDGRVIMGQVGDSRIYRLRQGRLVQLTHDQSEVGRMVRAGQLTEAESKAVRGRNVIDQSLGMRDDEFFPEIDWVETMPGDLFLLCSDGLVDRLEGRHLAEIIETSRQQGRTLAETAAELVAQSNRASGRDNTTALLVALAGSTSSAPAHPPPVPAATTAIAVEPAAPRATGLGGRPVIAGAVFVGMFVGVLVFWAMVHRPQAQLRDRRQAELAARIDENERLLAEEQARLATQDEAIDSLAARLEQTTAELAAARHAASTSAVRSTDFAARVAELEKEVKTLRERAIATEREWQVRVAEADARARDAAARLAAAEEELRALKAAAPAPAETPAANPPGAEPTVGPPAAPEG